MGLDFVTFNATFERAVSSTGFGRFHYVLLALCGLIYLDTAIELTILSFVVPAAKCDFKMTSVDSGWLNASPMLGMMVGCYFWGCLADLRGRKTVLIASLLVDGLSGLASSFSPYYPVFIVFRFIGGFGITGAMSICFPYLGEFQPTKYREKVLSWMELFWTAGVIALPLIAWAIIPLNFRFTSTYYTYASWNLFVTLCSIPSLLLAFWMCFMPESPKFMIECGEYDKALEVLKHMYAVNTGETPGSYPVRSLREKERGISVTSIQSSRSLKSVRTVKDLQLLMTDIWDMTKTLCKAPYRKYTLLTCIIQFGLTSGYYTLMMWFPELFNRYKAFETLHPGQSASVCDVSSVFINSEDKCVAEISSSVYLNTLFIGLACIPTSLWLPLCVRRLGTKFFLVFCLLIAGVVATAFYFVQNSTQNLVLSCIFEALTSLAISTIYCVMVDLFPTNLRVMAAALSMTFGRMGALLGNLVFGFLIDLDCVVPILLFASFLYISGILCFFLPNTGRTELE
uniref:Major facilitator superfamily (MFS) profile domain-containing protein n=1 Tax=Clastoptera arizonana TaxID=38151 RepID=A0A1B6CG08_9HEMI